MGSEPTPDLPNNQASEHGFIRRSIWRDDHFTRLPHEAQLAYFYLLTGPDTNHGYCHMVNLIKAFPSWSDKKITDALNTLYAYEWIGSGYADGVIDVTDYKYWGGAS